MRFADIIGHADAVAALREMADSGHIPHALLLNGPAGIGKTRLARAFAQYVHCRHRRDGDSCGVCPSCRQHASLNNADMHYVYPVLKRSSPKRAVAADYADEWREYLPANTYMPPEGWNDAIDARNGQPMIYVEESAEILRRAALSPLTEDCKIFLIWQAEKMNEQAANKLLKLIEEPYADTLFILVVNDMQRILPTIFSRTRRLNLRPVGRAELAASLTRLHGLEAAQADEIARLSEGSPARAEALVGHAAEPEEFRELFQTLMRTAYAGDAARLRDLADTIAGMQREKSRRFLTYCTRMMRENFIYNAAGAGMALLTAGEEAFSRRFAPFIHAGNVEEMAAAFDRAAEDIERNANAKIVAFDMALGLMALLRRPAR